MVHNSGGGVKYPKSNQGYSAKERQSRREIQENIKTTILSLAPISDQLDIKSLQSKSTKSKKIHKLQTSGTIKESQKSGLVGLSTAKPQSSPKQIVKHQSIP